MAIFDIVTCGSSTIDVFGDTNSDLIKIKGRKYEQDYIAYPSGVKILLRELNFKIGGGGVNTAIACSTLGLKTGFLGCLGQDSNGDLILEQLKAAGVEFLGVRCREQTGYSIILDSIEHDRTILKFSGANDFLEFGRIDKSRLRSKWLYITSMLGKSLNAALRLASWARKRGIKIAFNPSNYLIRENHSSVLKILRAAELFMVNETEAFMLTHLRGVKPQLRALRSLGAKRVIVTEGPEGAGYYDGRQCLYIKPHKVKPVEVTGAGDTFGASFVAGLIIKHGDVKHALRLAIVNAESVIKQMGATSGLLDYATAKRLMAKPTELFKI